MNSVISSESTSIHGLLHTRFVDQHALHSQALGQVEIPTDVLFNDIIKTLQDSGAFQLEQILLKRSAILRHDAGIVMVDYEFGNANFHVASGNQEDCQTVLDQIQKLVVMRKRHRETVSVNFWANRRGDATRRIRHLHVPDWETIQHNYAKRAQASMEQILAMTPEDIIENGRLILLYGEPGSGKTFFIRALFKKWSNWCNLHYVTDPERFFGDSDYMLSVVMDYGDSISKAPAPFFDDDDAAEEYKAPDWNLLILEDASEFLVADASLQAGQQSLARFLNLSQGLIGQGLNVIVVITTNEPIDKVHDAVKRDGRCLAEIEVPALSESEVLLWCKKHNVTPKGHGPQSIAKLYGLLDKHKKVVSRKETGTIGFAH